MAGRRPAAAQAEIAFSPSLKSCLVNLPSSLVQLLLNANTVAQNVVVELAWRQLAPPGSTDPKQKASGVAKSAYLGWTGMQSQTRLVPMVGRDGIAGTSRGGGRQEQEVSVVEVDATLGRLLGLSEAQKVCSTTHAPSHRSIG